jgi:3-deoxy-manno-octulosonate cytidylyltransferase (CMP-KDO synthetase)
MSQCPIEKAECLEQLRALWYGEKIHMGITTTPPGHGVDTPDDIARVEELLRNS